TREHVERVARQVDRKMAELAQATNLPPAQLAVLTAVNAVDDQIKSRDEIRRLQKENQRLQALLDERDAKA
ncbi:MAG: cell division protein ZapA, partial [Clostridiales bacterium]|nr:cell division protein ZapA [Clostridiales bacterium]